MLFKKSKPFRDNCVESTSHDISAFGAPDQNAITFLILMTSWKNSGFYPMVCNVSKTILFGWY